MATEVKVPAMGESISSGILATWHIKSGDYVEEGQAIYELETDKITSEANAEVSGVITIKVEADEEVEIGQVVATIDESAKGGSSSESGSKGDAAKSSAKESESPEESATASSGDEDASSNNEHPASTTDHPLSPAARKAAEETEADVSTIKGTGKDGRVTKHDILSQASKEDSSQGQGSGDSKQESGNREQETAQQAESKASTSASPKSGERETRKKMSPLRKKIAEHLVNASQQSAMLTTFNEVDMSAVMKLRKTHQDAFVARHGIKLGFMSFFTKAVTHALQAVPAVNARIEGNEVVTQHYYDIGVAVGTDKGLMVPVVRDCDQKDFAQIEKDIIGYAKAARDGKIQMSDLQGGVFTISNGGIYGSMLSTPIINFPQPAILGLHNIQERAVVIDGEIVARPMMYLAISYDHRLIDGKEAVTFLVKIKEAIEDPARLLFGI